MFVAGGHELEEQVRGVLFERDVADLVDDDQPVAPEPHEFCGQTAGLVRGLQPGDPSCCGGEQDTVA